jgi:molybdopterin/thiamine biosynthesis adenylyltransferase
MTTPDLMEGLARAAVDRLRADGTAYRSLSSVAERQLVRQCNQSFRRVELTALDMGIVPERYTRNMATLSMAEQYRLLEAKACVVGVGGLGGSVAEILARLGVGQLTLVDGDYFEDSNLNRQRFADTTTLGKPKAAVARKAIAAINPAVEVTVWSEIMTAENAAGMVAETDVAIDCLDTLQARIVLQGACRRQKIPMVSAAVAGVSGQITVIYPEDEGLSALYGDLSTAADRGAELTLGNLPFSVNLLACLECSEAVKVILKQASTLRGQLMIFDLADLTFETVQLA